MFSPTIKVDYLKKISTVIRYKDTSLFFLSRLWSPFVRETTITFMSRATSPTSEGGTSSSSMLGSDNPSFSSLLEAQSSPRAWSCPWPPHGNLSRHAGKHRSATMGRHVDEHKSTVVNEYDLNRGSIKRKMRLMCDVHLWLREPHNSFPPKVITLEPNNFQLSYSLYITVFL